MPKTVVVVGAGVAGMTTALEIRDRAGRVPGGLEIAVLEASDRPGGNIRTDREDGFVCEWGPNGYLDNVPTTPALVRRLGIEDRLFPSDESAAKRFLFRGGRLRQLPGSAGAFLRSDVLGWAAKLRVLGEPFGRRTRDEGDESVFDFASRRIGREAARVLVDAMVSGVYAGDARRLSLEATFPKMWSMEREHGSLTRAMLARRKEGPSTGGGGPAGPGGRLTSFRNGLQELTDALAAALGPTLRLRTPVRRVVSRGERGFRAILGEGAPLDVEAVVLACPAWFARDVTTDLDDELSRTLGEIPSASLAVVHLGYEASVLPAPLDGFGFLVPRGEGPRILGCLWSSSIFPGRAAAGKALLTSMIGGAHDPSALDLDDAALVAAVRADLERTMSIGVAPRFVRVFRHPRGIPQYTIGHPKRLETIAARLSRFPGLAVCGNSYRGISVNACVAEAPEVAEAVVTHLAGR